MEIRIDSNNLKDVKLIVFDLDGTLLNNQNQIGQDTIELVKKLRTMGVRFSFATGRLHSAIVTHAQTLDIHTPLISLDGCLIRSFPEHKTLFEFYIPKRYVKRALKLADEFLLKIALCSPDSIVYNENNSIIPTVLEKYGANYKEVERYEEYIDKTLEVVITSDYKPAIKKIMDKMSFPYTFGLSYSYYKSYSKGDLYFFEIRKHGCDKGTGVKRLAKYLKIDLNNVAALGDWHNDRELFNAVGVKVALANAVNEIKYHADIITSRTNEEDGTAEFLKMVLDSKQS